VVQVELQLAQPGANFYFHTGGYEFPGVLDDYEAGHCEVLAINNEDTRFSLMFLERLCDNHLVYTDSLIAEIPIGFPVRSELVAGLSYWINQGKRYHDTTIEGFQQEYVPVPSCNVDYSGKNEEASDYDQISVKNMFLPLIVLGVCAFIAILLQIKLQWDFNRGKKSLTGRRSTLDLVVEVDPTEKGIREKFSSNVESMIDEARKASLKYDYGNHDSLEEQVEEGGNENPNPIAPATFTCRKRVSSKSESINEFDTSFSSPS